MRPEHAIVVMAPQAGDLRELSRQINDHHERGEQAARQRLGHYRAAGEALLKAKPLCGHGKWLPWLKANVKCSGRQARKYMAFAELASGANLEEQEAEWQRVCGRQEARRQARCQARIAASWQKRINGNPPKEEEREAGGGGRGATPTDEGAPPLHEEGEAGPVLPAQEAESAENWVAFVHGFIQIAIRVRQGGGFDRLSSSWPQEERESVAKSLRSVADSLSEWASMLTTPGRA